MKYKFNEKNGIFTLFDPETGKDWSNHFFNDLSYVMSVSHTGVPYSRFIDQNAVQVTLNSPGSSFVNLKIAEPVVTIGLFQQFRYTLPALPGQVAFFQYGQAVCLSCLCHH